MPRSLLGKALWDRRFSTLPWLAGTAVVAGVMIAVYPVLRDSEAIQELLQRFPPALMALLGIDLTIFTTGIGFVSAQLYTFLAPLLCIAYCVGVGASATAAEEEEGTADLLLAQPVRRESVVLTRFLAMALGAAAMVAVLAGMLLLGNAAVDLRIPVAGIVGANVGLWLLGLFFGALAMLIGARWGKQRVAAGLVVAVAVAAFFLNGLSRMVESVRGLQPFLPFHWYQGGMPVRDGLQPGHALLAIATAILVAAAVLAFRRRDLRTDTPVLGRPQRQVRGGRFDGLLTSVFGHALWERRRSIRWWLLGLCGLCALTMAFWPTLAGEGTAPMEEVLKMVPKEVFAAIGLQDPATLLTPAGFITSRVYGSIGLVLVIVFAISTATRGFGRGKLDLLLSTPVERGRFVARRFLALAVLLAVLAAGLFLTVLAGDRILEFGMPFSGMLAANFGLLLIALLFGTLALAVACATGSASTARGATAAAAIAAFLLNVLGSLAPALAFTRDLSPFAWYLRDTPPLLRGVPPTAGLLAGCTAILAWIAVATFRRRDVY